MNKKLSLILVALVAVTTLLMIVFGKPDKNIVAVAPPAQQKPVSDTAPIQVPAPITPQTQSPVSPPVEEKALKEGELSMGDEVMLPEKPALIFTGITTWDVAFSRISNEIKALKAAAESAGLKTAGQPQALFTQTNDTGFEFKIFLPLEQMPSTTPALPEKTTLGKTQAGRALSFTHKAPYDDIDSTYEAITAYLDTKGLIVEDQFLEEYQTDFISVDDPSLEIRIYVFPK
jgi:effector-binding domain-containing protein